MLCGSIVSMSLKLFPSSALCPLHFDLCLPGTILREPINSGLPLRWADSSNLLYVRK